MFNSGWLSGFLDGDGSIFLDEQSNQLVLSITQKNRYLLDPLIRLYSGRIEILRSKDAFQYSIYRKKEILNLVDNYFNLCPLRSFKAYKLSMIKDFYAYKDYKNSDNPDNFNK
jgi:LAGLIDADG endonuclease